MSHIVRLHRVTPATNATYSRVSAIIGLVVFALVGTHTHSFAAAQRVLGADISYWNCGSSSTGISQANWNTAYSTGNRVFVFLRATRGGTTGVDQAQGTPGGGSLATLSRRYDDPRFVQNLIRATAAGMVVGPYHFARPDVSGNTGTDEADHFMQMAGAWMRPGYLMPMFDLEAGSGGDTLAQFAMDFSDRIYSVMKIRPCIYVNGNYSSILQSASAARRNALAQPATYTPSVVGPDYPMLWEARYSDNSNPNAIPIQTGSPKDTYTTLTLFYGPWDDYGDPAPWSFWQYASTVSMPGFNAVDATCDADVSHGDIEYVRNYLIPAVWWTDSSGDWSTLANWNCGQAPVAPVTPADQATPYATGGLPTARLPGAAGSGPTSGQYDTVILERPSANISVSLSSGIYNLRKLYMRETLTITGGALTINYNPTYRANDSTDVLHGGPISAQFSGPVILSGSGNLSVHTLQVDTAKTFTLSGGTLTFNTINLMPHSSTPAKLVVNGDVNVSPLANANATIANGAGSGSSGFVDLGGGNRSWNVGNGTAAVDLSVDVPVSNGALTKAGAGAMRLDVANSFSSGTTITAGTLEGAVPASIPGNVTNTAGILKLDTTSTLSTGATLALASSPGSGAVNLNFSGTQTISALYFGTTRKAAGTWAASGAAHNSSAFAGAGVLNVLSGPASSTAVALTSGLNPSAFGDSVTFTATVTGNTPGGTVQFKVDGVNSGSPVALVGGSASMTTSSLPIAGSPHQITAYYGGDDNNNPSDNSATPLAHVVTATPTACALVSSLNPSGPGTNVTFTATVSVVPPSEGTPTGSVIFLTNGAPFATNALAAGSAQASTAALPLGTNDVTAQYIGGSSFLGSTDSVAQVVQSAAVCSQTNALVSMLDNLDGTFTLTFEGTPQAQYYVLSSSDLTTPAASWAPVAGSTNTVTNVSGVWQFTVTNTSPQQFYRSRAVMPCP